MAVAETGHGGGARAAVLDYLKAHGRAGRKEIEQATALPESTVRKPRRPGGRSALGLDRAPAPNALPDGGGDGSPRGWTAAPADFRPI